MSDYSYAADQIKEGIISQYLKEHPAVKRSEVITKTINGKVVVGTIQDTFKTLESRNKLPDKSKKLLDELAKGGDERYSECLTSVSNSQKYIDWLFLSKFTGFSERDKKDHSEYLQRQTSVCSDRALDLHEAKQKFVQAIKNPTKPSRGAVNTVLLEYMQAVFGQLKAQKSIFKKEVDLGDRFASAVGQFFSTQFSGLRSRPNPAAMRAIARSISILKDNQVSMPELDNIKDVKVLDGALGQLQEKLSQRREQYALLQQLIDYLEKAIADLKATMGESTDKSEEKSSTRRMAFTSKRVGR